MPWRLCDSTAVSDDKLTIPLISNFIPNRTWRFTWKPWSDGDIFPRGVTVDNEVLARSTLQVKSWRHNMEKLTSLTVLCEGNLLPIDYTHSMMTSSNGTFSALLALGEGNPSVTGGFPSQRPVTWSLDVFFDLHPNKRLSKQSRRWWFKTPSRSLWRHSNEISMKSV